MPDDAPELTDTEIEHLARELLHRDTRAEVRGAVDIGERVLAAVYRGDFGAFQRRDPYKADSVARLARACGWPNRSPAPVARGPRSGSRPPSSS